MSEENNENYQQQTPKQFILFTLVVALVASSATWLSLTLNLEVWIMFAGFIAWFTGPASLRDGLTALICFYLGMFLAVVASAATGSLIPYLGSLALPTVVFFVASLIVGLRTISYVNNMLGWFLGMVTFYASHLGASVESFQILIGASVIGGLAGWLIQTINRRLVLSN